MIEFTLIYVKPKDLDAIIITHAHLDN